MNYMDHIYSQANQLGLVGDDAEAARLRFPLLLLAPLGSAIPDDGLLDYRTFERASELLEPIDGTVWLVDVGQIDLVKAVVSNADAFGVRAIVLFGVPGTEYTQAFGDATFGCERWSYTSVVSALRENADLAQLQKDSSALSKHDRERAQFTRKDGSVRYHDEEGISVAGGEDDDDTQP